MAWWRKFLPGKSKRDYDKTIDGPLVDAYMDVYNLQLRVESDIKAFSDVANKGVPDIAAEKAKVLGNRGVSVPTGNYFEDQATIEQWQFVLTYNPKNINAYLSIGELELAHKQKRLAKKSFTQAHEIDPENEHALRRMKEFS